MNTPLILTSTPGTNPNVLQTGRQEPLSPELARALDLVETEAWADLYRAASADDVSACGLRMDTIGSASLMMATGIDVLAFNRVVGLGMGVQASEALLDEIIGRFDDEGVPRFFIQISPTATSPHLHEWLARRGLRYYNSWVKLFRDTTPPPEIHSDLHVEPADPEHASSFAHILASCFDWPNPVRPWVARLVGRPGWHPYLAFDGDTPVAAAAFFLSGDYGYMGPAATLPAYRGRGAQNALIARRIRDSATYGCKMLITETAEERPESPAPSNRNMRRLGFRAAYVRPNYIRTPGLCP